MDIIWGDFRQGNRYKRPLQHLGVRNVFPVNLKNLVVEQNNIDIYRARPKFVTLPNPAQPLLDGVQNLRFEPGGRQRCFNQGGRIQRIWLVGQAQRPGFPHRRDRHQPGLPNQQRNRRPQMLFRLNIGAQR